MQHCIHGKCLWRRQSASGSHMSLKTRSLEKGGGGNPRWELCFLCILKIRRNKSLLNVFLLIKNGSPRNVITETGDTFLTPPLTNVSFFVIFWEKIWNKKSVFVIYGTISVSGVGFWRSSWLLKYLFFLRVIREEPSSHKVLGIES